MAKATMETITITFDDETKELLRALARLLAARDQRDTMEGKRRLSEPKRDVSFGDA